jgi:hypothetical protein
MAANWAVQFSAGSPSWQPLFSTGAVAIVDCTGGETTAVVSYSGAASYYRLNGGSSIGIGSSPATITGLTVNTEYTIEISADGASWSDPVNFGTLNPGNGGGSFSSTVPGTAVASLSAAVQQALALSAVIGAAVQAQRSAQAVLDAYVQAASQVNALLNAAIQAAASASTSLSAYVTDESAPAVIGARSGSARAVRPVRSNTQRAQRSN